MSAGRPPGRPVMLPPALRALMLLTDIGFIGYWVVTVSHVLPATWLFKDYDHPILQSWNWSFLPLDLAVSATGLGALHLAGRSDGRAAALAIGSLVLTSASGLMAVAFWTLRADFDPVWWGPNLFLLFYPFAFLPGLISRAAAR